MWEIVAVPVVFAPAKGPDFNPLDYFLWTFLKHRVYHTKHTDIGFIKVQNESLGFTKVQNEFFEVQLNLRFSGYHLNISGAPCLKLNIK